MIDVGQGAATLFELSCAAVLVDTGGELGDAFDSGRALQTYLDGFFERRADLRRTLALLVITHPHLDHTRNIQRVVEHYDVKNVVTDGLTSGSGGPQQTWLQHWAKDHARYDPARASGIGHGGRTSSVIDPVSCTDVDPVFRILWGGVEPMTEGWSHAVFANENNHSVVLRADVGRASFLITGDLQEEGIKSVLAHHGGSGVLDVDVWQVSHHGSHNGVTRAWLDVLTPTMALIATGPPDREAQWTAWAFGHPRKVVLELLRDSIARTRQPIEISAGVAARRFERFALTKAIYGTGWDGTVVVSATKDGRYRVQTQR